MALIMTEFETTAVAPLTASESPGERRCHCYTTTSVNGVSSDTAAYTTALQVR